MFINLSIWCSVYLCYAYSYLTLNTLRLRFHNNFDEPKTPQSNSILYNWMFGVFTRGARDINRSATIKFRLLLLCVFFWFWFNCIFSDIRLYVCKFLFLLFGLRMWCAMRGFPLDERVDSSLDAMWICRDYRTSGTPKLFAGRQDSDELYIYIYILWETSDKFDNIHNKWLFICLFYYWYEMKEIYRISREKGIWHFDWDYILNTIFKMFTLSK